MSFGSRTRVVSLVLCVVGAAAVWFSPSDQLRAGVQALALVVLAGVGALLASRGHLRRLLSFVLVLAGLGLTLGGSTMAIVGGLTVVAGACMAVVTSPGWSVMGARYQRAVKEEKTDLWAALDRGEDPTA